MQKNAKQNYYLKVIPQNLWLSQIPRQLEPVVYSAAMACINLNLICSPRSLLTELMSLATILRSATAIAHDFTQ